LNRLSEIVRVGYGLNSPNSTSPTGRRLSASTNVLHKSKVKDGLAIVFSQMDIDLQSQRDQILAELQSAVAQRQQTWDMYVLVQRQKMAELSGGRITVPNDAYGFPGTLLETWSWSQYFSDAGGNLWDLGVGDGSAFYKVGEGLWNGFWHPLDTGAALLDAVVRWREMGPAILSHIKEKSTSFKGWGELWGEGVMFAATAGVVNAVAKSGRVVSVLNKVKDVAKKLPKLRPASKLPSQRTQTVFEPIFAAKQTLRGGRVHIDDIKRLVPDGTRKPFSPSKTIADGRKFQYEVNGTKVEIKWHSPDAAAAAKYPGSRSGSMWTAQIKIGKKLLGLDGKLYTKPNGLTHIPIDF
jgi:hypothetical protein